MAATCQKCNTSGANMLRCRSCSRIFCIQCDSKGSETCPQCGDFGPHERNP
jgi:hypothetical protein